VGEGKSNIVYLISRDGGDFVLRRPPRPPLPPSAHDVLREARLLTWLEGSKVRIPRVLAVCDDETVIGAPFYVMERVVGEVVSERIPPALDSPEGCAQISHALIDALVEVHGFDWSETPLRKMASRTPYLARQLRRFTGLWEHNRTRQIGDMDRVAGWLHANRPEAGEATVVHGDYRLGNVLFSDRRPARLEGILDWEMATIGDPLADVGYLCATWIEAADPHQGLYEVNAITRRPGFLPRAELAERYAEASGRNCSRLRYYEVLAWWKSAIVMEGNYRRAAEGLSDDPFLKEFADGVRELAARAVALI
jgi:aminoglycoside phosphotransferase (APT) family kinase protein